MTNAVKELKVSEIKKNILGKTPKMKGPGWELRITLRREAAIILTQADRTEIKKGIIGHIRCGTTKLDDPLANHHWELIIEEGYTL